jgi:hypothetical protein
MRHNPCLYEFNARLFLRRMSDKYRRRLTLATIPEEAWQELVHQGFDLVWLMGVWQRSPGSRQRALIDPVLRQAYDQALPGWTDDDIGGSPYAIYAYSPDPSLGGPEELTQLRRKLNQYGLGLVLDFIPNHLAVDHPWTLSYPGRFVQGRDTDVHNHPDWFFSPEKGAYLAHGRDPNFPPWTDTAQLSFYSDDLRQALIKELWRVTEVADGVRCDMAMLALNDVFGDVWGEVITGYTRPETEFWAEAIGQVKQRRPDFLFLAEVYWGLEKALQELGFDFTYNKQLYDRLRLSSVEEIRRYLMSDSLYLKRSAHFIENHDEPRAVIAFGQERSLAAAVIMSTIPGLRIFHDGQFIGRRVQLPVQMVREPKEVPDSGVMQFYERLMAICTRPAFHDGEWRLMKVNHTWEGNESNQSLLAWSWHYTAKTEIVILNYSPNPAQGRLKVPLPEVNKGKIQFLDELTGITYVRDPDEVRNQGLYIALEPYQAHLFNIDMVQSGEPCL